MNLWRFWKISPKLVGKPGKLFSHENLHYWKEAGRDIEFYECVMHTKAHIAIFIASIKTSFYPLLCAKIISFLLMSKMLHKRLLRGQHVKIQFFLAFQKDFTCCWSGTVFENYSKCLIWILTFWRFSTIFVLLKVTCLVSLFDRKLQLFKNSPKSTIFGIFTNYYLFQ